MRRIFLLQVEGLLRKKSNIPSKSILYTTCEKHFVIEMSIVREFKKYLRHKLEFHMEEVTSLSVHRSPHSTLIAAKSSGHIDS